MIKTLKTVFTQKTHEGTTERLLQLSFCYFGLYVITGFLAKYFDKVLGVGGIQYTFYNTIAGMLICNAVVIIWGWYKFQSTDKIKFLGMNMPREFFYIIPSGICTGIVIPTTTLMYTLPISVMVAMIIMRASIIVISRLIDEAQIRQGILKKKVYWEENVAVVIALCAVALQMLNFKGAAAMVQSTGNYAIFPLLNQLFIFDKENFNFLGNPAAMTILTFYLIAYTIRIYIMNYYKNTRKPGAVYDTKGFFAVEQIASTTALVLAGFIFFLVVNKPPAAPVSPITRYAATAPASPELDALNAVFDKAGGLLVSDNTKFTPEQLSETGAGLAAAAVLLADPKAKPEELKAAAENLNKPVKAMQKTFAYQFSDAAKNPTPKWLLTLGSGVPFGMAAFFSVFLFMFKGRTATFAGLVNRLTSLVAGTGATIMVWWLIKDQKPPKTEDWLGLVLMFLAIYFIGKSEKRRAHELIKAHEIKAEKGSEIK